MARKKQPKYRSLMSFTEQLKPAEYFVSLMNEDGSSYRTRSVFALSGQLAAEEYVRLYAMPQAAIGQSIDVSVADSQNSQVFTVALSVTAKLR